MVITYTTIAVTLTQIFEQNRKIPKSEKKLINSTTVINQLESTFQWTDCKLEYRSRTELEISPK